MTPMIAKKWRILGVLGALCVPALVSAALSLPFSFKAGDPIKASQVNANFEALRAQLDALTAGAPPRQLLGTFTLEGILSAAPIRGFTQSIDVPVVAVGAGQGSAKPVLSNVQIIRDAGDGTPPLDLLLNQQKHAPSADIVLGNLSVHLSDVIVQRVTVGGVQAGRAQETISLNFESIEWTWKSGKDPAKVVSFDLVKGTGTAATTLPASFAYSPPGVALDESYVPITSYDQDMGCATPQCKVTHSALSVQKLAGAESLDLLGTSLSNKRTQKLNVTWFSSATAITHSIDITDFVVSHVTLSSNDDGTLGETDSFSYATISWSAGKAKTGWDLTKNTSL
ncbi:MAG: type VI secretion system tube protein Hcp [Polyangiaceae bacterium]